MFIYGFSKLFENPLLFLFLALHFHHSLLVLLVERVLSCSFIWIHLIFMVLPGVKQVHTSASAQVF